MKLRLSILLAIALASSSLDSAAALYIPPYLQHKYSTSLAPLLNRLGHGLDSSLSHASAVPLLPAARPLKHQVAHGGNAIPHSYIVVLDESLAASRTSDEIDAILNEHVSWVTRLREAHVDELAKSNNQQQQILSSSAHLFAQKLQPFRIANFMGYSGYLPPETLAVLRKAPGTHVKYIEPNVRVSSTDLITQRYASWGLARISNREQLTASTFSRYLYDDMGGEGVTAYVVDSGIYADHNDFEGRAVWGTVTVDEQNASGGPDYEDRNGHGTHCAGIIAGKGYGVAKKTRLVAVKVLAGDGSGSIDSVVQGLDWVVKHHEQEKKHATAAGGTPGSRSRGSIVNLSLGCGYSQAINAAVEAVSSAGIHVVVSAGNEDSDSCLYSPASSPAAVTVGASTFEDTRAWFSNGGACVDVFAPGYDIWSDFIGEPDADARRSGTSMAAPYVSGLVAYFLALQPSTDSEYSVAGPVTPAQMRANLQRLATVGALYGVANDTANLLVYNGGGLRDTGFWT